LYVILFNVVSSKVLSGTDVLHISFLELCFVFVLIKQFQWERTGLGFDLEVNFFVFLLGLEVEFESVLRIGQCEIRSPPVPTLSRPPFVVVIVVVIIVVVVVVLFVLAVLDSFLVFLVLNSFLLVLNGFLLLNSFLLVLNSFLVFLVLCFGLVFLGLSRIFCYFDFNIPDGDFFGFFCFFVRLIIIFSFSFGWLLGLRLLWLFRLYLPRLCFFSWFSRCFLSWLSWCFFCWLSRCFLGWLSRCFLGWLSRSLLGWLSWCFLSWFSLCFFGWFSRCFFGWFSRCFFNGWCIRNIRGREDWREEQEAKEEELKGDLHCCVNETKTKPCPGLVVFVSPCQ